MPVLHSWTSIPANGLKALGLLLGLFAGSAQAASSDAQLLEAINTYRTHSQTCAGQQAEVLTPLVAEPRLVLPVDDSGYWQDHLVRSGYPVASAKTIRLTGPVDAQAAFAMLQARHCHSLLDPQFVDIGVSQAGSNWRIVLARPLLDDDLGEWQEEGQVLLVLVNALRTRSRNCGDVTFAPAPPVAWNAALGTAAERYSRAMANGNFFARKPGSGVLPADLARAAGYRGQQLDENIAAGFGRSVSVIEGWLATPVYCARIMDPRFTELGAGYAVDPQSDAGIYWTLLLGTH
ncbi:CAP domain-containing protein [Pseudomonas sp. JM0905a]|uniref:CAP domain-containing protein n=1 Tax=Pseudomonas sp. JM0905a TaxID=2772484 RepID=UPI001683B92A|nr:CAP domain-containing protein [Pseudomonas sp. JM0905a]MBD2839853.1 CAP domain-containing protein [Pseudomonas sp. JM0905a]